MLLLSAILMFIVLNSIIFRLKQKNPDQSERTPSTQCDEPVEIIRVTVSVFVKRSIKGGNNRTANSRRVNSRRGTNFKCHAPISFPCVHFFF